MKKLLYTLPLLLGLAACSQDDLNVEQPQLPELELAGDAYYLSMEITVPTEISAGTRAQDNDGFTNSGVQQGTQNEYAIKDVTLYFLDATAATKDQVLLTLPHYSIETAENANEAKYDQSYKVKFLIWDGVSDASAAENQIDEFMGLYGKNTNMVVVCNSTAGSAAYTLNAGSTPKSVTLSTALSSADAAPIGDFYNASAATGESNQGKVLPMASVERKAFNKLNTAPYNTFTSSSSRADKIAALRQLFKVEDDYLIYDLEQTSIDVERMVARLDIKDKNDTNNWTYQITSSEDPSNIKIVLNSIQPFNVNNNFYIFRHRAGGDATMANEDTYLLDGTTTASYKWVVDPTWDNFVNATTARGKTVTGKFLNALSWGATFDPTTPYTVTGNVGKTKIADLTSTTTNVREKQQGYYPWWYVTENTLPSTSLMKLYNEEENVDGSTTTYNYTPLLPAYATGVAFNFQILKQGKAAGETDCYVTKTTAQADLPAECKITAGESGNITKLMILMPESGKWMEIEPDTNGDFYLTYFGFIMHNLQTTGTNIPMKYGVVRNNIYQLSINKIENLPFPEDPMAMFLQLTINVLKWDVRTNEFNF